MNNHSIYFSPLILGAFFALHAFPAYANNLPAQDSLWKVPSPKADFSRALDGTLDLAEIKNNQLHFYQWELPENFKLGVPMADQLTSSTGEIWRQTASIPLDFDYSFSTETTDSIYFWDQNTKQLCWVDWDNTEAGFSKTPLQFNALDDIADSGDVVFALGAFTPEVSLIAGTKTELTTSGNWIVPGPIPDGRRGAKIQVLDDQFIALVGGVITNSNGQQLFPTNQLSIGYNNNAGLSLFRNHAFPVSANIVHSVSQSNDLVGIFHPHPEAQNITQIQYTYAKPEGSLTIWYNGNYQFTYTPDDILFTDEELNLLFRVDSQAQGSEFTTLQAYILPQSKRRARQAAEKVRADFRRVNYVYYKPALKRAESKQSNVFVVLAPEADPVRAQFEDVYRNYSTQVMLEGVILSQASQEDVKDVLERLPAGAETPLFLLLSPQGEVISTRSEAITDRAQIFELLKPLWEPVNSTVD